MLKTYLIIFALYFGLFFQSCAPAPIKYIHRDTKSEIREYQATESETSSTIASLKAEITNLEKQKNITEAEKDKIDTANEKKILKLKNKNTLLAKHLMSLKEENQKILEETKALKKEKVKPRKIEKKAAKKKTAKRQRVKKEDIQRLKIKVLSGSGNLSSARKMANKLGNLGYNIKLIGLAPRSNFKKNTVYYASRHKINAKKLAQNLGADTVLKPLTWSSIFDLIVVAGESL